MGTIFQQYRRLVSIGKALISSKVWHLLAIAASRIAAEHASPAGELDVRGVDDAPGLVGIRYDLEQEPGSLLVDRHVAELVDDQEPGLGDLPELRVEPVLFSRELLPTTSASH